MQIKVLGKSPSWQDAGGASSGYLVREHDYALLLDCGTGVFARLRREFHYRDTDAVLLTHLHPDHFFDVVPFAFALHVGPGERGRRPQLWARPGAREVFRALQRSWSEGDGLIEGAFEVHEYDPAAALTLGPLRVRFCEVPHYTRTYAVELTSDGDGGRFTYSADCGPNDNLVQFARATDLLLIEATLTEPEPDEERGHMTAAEAAELGRRAGARKLVLTHFSDELDPDRMRAQAEESFEGPVELASEGAVYTV